jgi:alpha-L-arabinofuranosidase
MTMKSPFHRLHLVSLVIVLTAQMAFAEPARIIIDADRPGIAISPMLYGVFFEEINRAGDGGIYAEMIQNRSFEDADFPVAWSLVQDGGAESAMSLDKTHPLNARNPTCLKLEVTKPGWRAGVANEGFKGIPKRPTDHPDQWREKREKAAAKSTSGLNIVAGKEYDLSLYDSAGNGARLDVTLEKLDGTVLAKGSVTGLGAEWNKFTLALKATASDANARLVISTRQPGVVRLDMVSLIPRDTWKGRPNGLRSDLMEKIAAMKPAFVRFPGGCFVEGDRLANAARWKETIGDIAERPGHWNLWGYRSTDGLGMFEYLQMCEDLGAEPLFVVNCGMSHAEQAKSNKNRSVPIDPQYVQDALDAIEYANGPVTSKWGALRAKAGHPAPFNLRLIEIGNENGGPVYNERYALFYDAIKAKYPDMQIIACTWGGRMPANRPLEIVDVHDYNTPQNFCNNSTRYDHYDRNGPKVYFGEYAVARGGCGHGNLRVAVAEAAFMTGLERNSDVVRMSSYAPLLVEPSWQSWNPNAIHFTSSQTFGTPSYYVQAMFGANRPDVNLPVEIRQPEPALIPVKGMISLGTWQTQAEFKDIKVTAGGKTLFRSDFSKDLAGWKRVSGGWKVEGGAVRQASDGADSSLVAGDPAWSDYTLELKARKLSGKEGFLIGFGMPNERARARWNLGGLANTGYGLEFDGLSDARVPGSIEKSRWYDIRIEIKGATVKCWLDGKLIHDVVRKKVTALYAVAGTDKKTGEIIVKVVNASDKPIETVLELKGSSLPAGDARVTVLTSGSPDDENSFDAPTKVSPREETLRVGGKDIIRTFPANSVTILRIPGLSPLPSQK